LLADAQSLSNASWNAAFYDEIAPHVSGYAPSSTRGTISATVRLPSGASDATFVLSANGYHFQDSALDPSAYQYWGTLDAKGDITIDRVKAGTYRITVYAKGDHQLLIPNVNVYLIAVIGIFGDFVQDNIVIDAGKNTHFNLKWTAESAGRELWRIGIPDKTSGEFANGFERDLTHPRQPASTSSFASVLTRLLS
jgi:rhamnogalacturonan endolyase